MASVQPEEMVLRVTVNSEDKGDRFVSRTAGGDFMVREDDFKALGIQPAAAATAVLNGDRYVSLRSIQGVRYSFDARALTLAITADPRLLPVRALGSPTGPGRGFVPHENSGFLNYALDTQSGTALQRALWTGTLEGGWRQGDDLFVSNGATTQSPDGGHRFVRLMSSATRDERDTLRRWVVGDFFTPSRELGNGVNLGGLSLSKLYDLNPYLVRFPTQTLSGQVALPSQLEVYLDGQKIRSETVSPGQFQLTDILAYNGARNVQVVLRDSFGRTQTLDYAFYFSDRPLQAGLHEYSYNLGAFRRRYGLESDRYGKPAFSLFHRYGFTRALTLGVRADGAPGFVNAGPSATLVLGRWGVANLAAAFSRASGLQGSATSLGYNFQGARWNLGLSLRRDQGNYAVMGEPPTLSNRRYEGNASLGYTLPKEGGSITLSQSVMATDPARSSAPSGSVAFLALTPQRVSSIAYTRSIVSGRVSLTASLTRTRDTSRRTEAFVGLTYFFDRQYTANANLRQDGDRHSEVLQFMRNQPIGEGLGYQLTAGRSADASGSSTTLLSQAQYNAPAVILRAEYDASRSPLGPTATTERLSVAGSVAYVGGETALGRPLTDSFAIVRVGEVPGVKVMAAAQDIGMTDAHGRLLVPNLNAYFDNQISIAPETVPIDYEIAATSRTVSPSARSGAIIDFEARKIQAFSGLLKYEAGSGTVPLVYQSLTLLAGGKSVQLQTGREGEFYLENIAPGTYRANAMVEGRPCPFEIVIPRSGETFVDLPDFVCRLQP
ncbi:fimbrial biogenesis outer membrane usher protein [Ramlibacter aquaticus]|uniref:Fimbrial biogenesis outer membrane usher protein n=1 Tax=Ramlibacter aquaticus TaxID=2780094 RepID=A0ABR9SBI4_9BURK|nr:fimbria/pilus outer membrane usher protein [Ramlibacter aquaticus]MBE7939693.1 fimbrial biogenesis outer membrane usher protein [Ramlibacter aquaticus]